MEVSILGGAVEENAVPRNLATHRVPGIHPPPAVEAKYYIRSVLGAALRAARWRRAGHRVREQATRNADRAKPTGSRPLEC